MVPTLNGRIQTRLILLAIIGGLVTLIIVPVLPGNAPLGDKYRDGFIVLAAVMVLGVAWECLYHFLMQWRWEKDWPTLFGLATGVPEGLLIWILLAAGAIPGIVGTVGGAAFIIQFALIWLAVWLPAHGPRRGAVVKGGVVGGGAGGGG